MIYFKLLKIMVRCTILKVKVNEAENIYIKKNELAEGAHGSIFSIRYAPEQLFDSEIMNLMIFSVMAFVIVPAVLLH